MGSPGIGAADTLLLDIVRDIRANLAGKLARLGSGCPADTASCWLGSVNDVELLQTLETLVDCALGVQGGETTLKTVGVPDIIRLFDEYNARRATITDRQAAFLLQRISRAGLGAAERVKAWRGFLDLAMRSPLGEGYLLVVTLGALILAGQDAKVVSRAAECLMILGDYRGAGTLMKGLHERATGPLVPGSPALEAAAGILDLSAGLLSLREQNDDERRLRAMENSLFSRDESRVVGVSVAAAKAKTAVEAAVSDAKIPIIFGERGVGKRHLARYFHSLVAPGEAIFTIDLGHFGAGGLSEAACGRINSVMPGLRPPRGILTMAGRGTLIFHGAECLGPGDVEFLRALLVRREYRPVDDTFGPYLPVRARFVICFDSKDQNFPGGLSRSVPSGFAASIGGIVIHLPPLRSRVEDIPWLADHFVNSAPSHDPAGSGSRRGDRRVLDKPCRERLKAYFWQGNVDELKMVSRAMAALSSGQVIHETFLPERILGRFRQAKESI